MTADQLRLDRLVAHRELQLLRAGAFARGQRGRSWIAARQRKLDQARRTRERLSG